MVQEEHAIAVCRAVPGIEALATGSVGSLLLRPCRAHRVSSSRYGVALLSSVERTSDVSQCTIELGLSERLSHAAEPPLDTVRSVHDLREDHALLREVAVLRLRNCGSPAA